MRSPAETCLERANERQKRCGLTHLCDQAVCTVTPQSEGGAGSGRGLVRISPGALLDGASAQAASVPGGEVICVFAYLVLVSLCLDSTGDGGVLDGGQ